MGKNSKKRMTSLLLEYLRDSKRSDREIAKTLEVSQPTVTRRRQRLVREGWIKDFTLIPDFVKIGYEIMAISSCKLKVDVASIEKAKKVVMAKPNVIFASEAEGMGKNGVIISFHTSYTDFTNFLLDIRSESGDALQDCDSLLVDLKGKTVKPFSLTYLGEQKEA